MINRVKRVIHKLYMIDANVSDMKIKQGEMIQKQNDLKIQSSELKDTSSQLVNRIEVVRDEILYELRAMTGNFSDTSKNDIIVEYLSPEKFKDNEIRLNLGCGHIPIEHYINVDSRNLKGVDLVSDVTKLPFSSDSVDEIYCAHLVEHFTELQLKKEIFPHWFAILKPGAKLKIIVPDAVSMSKAYVNGEMSFDDFKLVTFGAQDYSGDFHYTMFSTEYMSTLLDNSGFKNIQVVDTNRKNGLCREFEIECEK